MLNLEKIKIVSTNIKGQTRGKIQILLSNHTLKILFVGSGAGEIEVLVLMKLKKE